VTTTFYAMYVPGEVSCHLHMVAYHIVVTLFTYDVPLLTHMKMPFDVHVRLSEDGVLAGVKDSSADDISFHSLLLATQHLPDFAVFTGHEVVTDGAMLGGAAGIVPGLGNVDPAGYVRIFDAARAEEWAAVVAEQDRLARLFEITGAATPGR